MIVFFNVFNAERVYKENDRTTRRTTPSDDSTNDPERRRPERTERHRVERPPIMAAAAPIDPTAGAILLTAEQLQAAWNSLLRKPEFFEALYLPETLKVTTVPADELPSTPPRKDKRPASPSKPTTTRRDLGETPEAQPGVDDVPVPNDMIQAFIKAMPHLESRTTGKKNIIDRLSSVKKMEEYVDKNNKKISFNADEKILSKFGKYPIEYAKQLETLKGIISTYEEAFMKNPLGRIIIGLSQNVIEAAADDGTNPTPKPNNDAGGGKPSGLIDATKFRDEYILYAMQNNNLNKKYLSLATSKDGTYSYVYQNKTFPMQPGIWNEALDNPFDQWDQRTKSKALETTGLKNSATLSVDFNSLRDAMDTDPAVSSSLEYYLPAWHSEFLKLTKSDDGTWVKSVDVEGGGGGGDALLTPPPPSYEEIPGIAEEQEVAKMLENAGHKDYKGKPGFNKDDSLSLAFLRSLSAVGLRALKADTLNAICESINKESNVSPPLETTSVPVMVAGLYKFLHGQNNKTSGGAMATRPSTRSSSSQDTGPPDDGKGEVDQP